MICKIEIKNETGTEIEFSTIMIVPNSYDENQCINSISTTFKVFDVGSIYFSDFASNDKLIRF